MSVLRNGDVDKGDFSEALPAITDKLLFLVNGLRNVGFSENVLDPTDVDGLGLILQDIQDDLQIISQNLGSRLNEVVKKQRFLIEGIQKTALSENYLDSEPCHGLAHILEDVIDDLEKINNALYPVREIGELRQIKVGAA